jgi:hypothetical protein
VYILLSFVLRSQLYSLIKYMSLCQISYIQDRLEG